MGIKRGESVAEVQRLREAGWELCEASGNGELWKIYPARLRWQEVNPR